MQILGFTILLAYMIPYTDKFITKKLQGKPGILSEIWGAHSSEDVKCGFLGHYAILLYTVTSTLENHVTSNSPPPPHKKNIGNHL
jgi:hypothetical protein